MSGRGMFFVSVPNFGGELRQGFSRNIAVIRGDLVHPNNEFVLLLSREVQNTLF